LLGIQKQHGVQPPVVALLTLCDVRGFVMKGQKGTRRSIDGPHYAIDRDHLFVPEVLIESFDCDVEAVLRPIIDSVWNAAGFAESPVKGSKSRS